MLPIPIERDHELRTIGECMFEAFPQTRGFAGVALVAQHRHRQALQLIHRVIAGAVVDDHDIRNNFQRGFSQRTDSGGFVVGGNDDNRFSITSVHIN